jgi:tetratricopeptide (TPR) repeat protein
MKERWAVIASLLLMAGCRDRARESPCLRQDLGPFRLAAIEPGGSDDACSARYRDPAGREAEVRVRRGSILEVGEDAGRPFTFEKQRVRSRPDGDGVRVSWHSRSRVFEVRLPKAYEPQGPVLRAYLLHHPSDLEEEAAVLEDEVQSLRNDSRDAPRDPGPHMKLARNYWKLGNTIMAAQEFQIAVSVDPDCAECFFEMGRLYRELRHWDFSIRALRKAAALAPAEARIWLLLGDVNYDVHNRQEAELAYRKALAAGLAAGDAERAQKRLADLEGGKFMFEPLPKGP